MVLIGIGIGIGFGFGFGFGMGFGFGNCILDGCCYQGEGRYVIVIIMINVGTQHISNQMYFSRTVSKVYKR